MFESNQENVFGKMSNAQVHMKIPSIQMHVYFAKHSSNITGSYSQLVCVCMTCRKLPTILVERYCHQALALDLSYNQLTSLQGVDQFQLLQHLVLDNNNFSDNICVPRLPHLQTLTLNNNNIHNLESLLNQLCNNLPNLTYLSLLGNAACPNQLSDMDKDESDYQRYRYYVVYRLPGLKFLDSTKVLVTEKNEAGRRGQLMRVVGPNDTIKYGDVVTTAGSFDSYTPLPTSRRNMGDHQGAYGKCRYRYSGKHSEGNRFIRNNDL